MQGEAALPYSPNTASRGDAADGPSGSPAARMEFFISLLGSLPRVERDARFKELSPELRELCLHLIAAHHGFARPLLRTDGAEEPPSVLVRRAQDIALRFARLERIWGPWGLAWWEALLRAADQRASRRNDEGGGHG
jgi:CRISPR-associated endonuclease/helicase Cas3